jgi:hypothetical protein
MISPSPILTAKSWVDQESRFPYEINGTKVFLWILGIETALNLTSLGARARAGATIRLSPHVRFALNSLLVTLMVVPGGVHMFFLIPTSKRLTEYNLICLSTSHRLALLLWISILIARSLRGIETNTDGIVATLIEAAPSYRSETYSYPSVLRLLKPMASTLEIAVRRCSH